MQKSTVLHQYYLVIHRSRGDQDADQEREKAAARLRRAKAKEHQRKVMEQLAQQRKRFMDNMESSGIKIDDIEGGGSSGAGAKETGPTTAASGAVTDGSV